MLSESALKGKVPIYLPFRDGVFLLDDTAVESTDHAKSDFDGSDGGPAPATKRGKSKGLAVKARVVVSSCRPFQLIGHIAHNPCAGKSLSGGPGFDSGSAYDLISLDRVAAPVAAFKHHRSSYENGTFRRFLLPNRGSSSCLCEFFAFSSSTLEFLFDVCH